MKFIKSLTIADWLSMAALGFGWMSILSILDGNWKLSNILFICAFVCDLLDGYLARKVSKPTVYGRSLDSCVDIVVYLVFSSLFVWKFYTFMPNLKSSTSFAILFFGILRLVRYMQEGMKKDEAGLYYRGITVVHIAFATIIGYMIMRIFAVSPIIVDIVLVIVSIGMLSDFKSRKISSCILALIAAIVGVLVIFVP